MLELHDIVKRFGPTIALDGASLTVRPGTVHALLGENGAGKTTLMRVVFGMTRADAGEVRYDGQPVRWRTPADAIAHGVGMVQQHFALVPAMTVAENVALGMGGRYDPRGAAERVRRLGAATGLELDPEARVADLGVAAQQRVEIIKALGRDARLLILDEPTAVLVPAEAAELLDWVRRFADGGRAVVLITHKLRDALDVADDVTVLRHGRTVLAIPASAASERSLAEAMLGAPRRESLAALVGEHEIGRTAREPVPSRARGAPPDKGIPPVVSRTTTLPSPTGAEARAVIRARGVTVRDARGVVRLRDASLEVHAGEIVGVAAVEGSGQRELLRVLGGRLTPTAGTIELPPAVGFVPEDRHHDALVLEFSLYENVALHGLGARRGRMPWRALRRATAVLLEAFDVRAPGADTRAGALSGGNQQKLVLGRELAEQPAALVVESPTRGLDIRASEAVHERLRAAREAGTAVVVYSADLDEVLALADRMLVVHAGEVCEVPHDREQVGRAMLGAGSSAR